ncbi:hypothetical protein [Aeoliella sp.]|uniref:hypothetical protein n=1 Tax=Aeoliella sp. TaxID=2795800 RepID=UPI003CCC420D
MHTDQILAEDGVTLRPSPLKWLGILFGSLVFVAGGVFLVAMGLPKIGWVVISAFSTYASVAFVVVNRPLSWLRITRGQLQVIRWHQLTSYDWREIDCFGVADMHFGRRVGIGVVEGHPSIEEKSAKRNFGRFGYHEVLPDTYGTSAEELAELLNQVHAQLADAHR